MLAVIAISFVILLGSRSHLVSSSSDQMNLHLCMGNKTVSVQILAGAAAEAENSTCQCLAGPSSDPYVREDYEHTPGVGWHKLHTTPKTWNEARKICKEENAHLAIINSKAEARALLDMLQRKADVMKKGPKISQGLLGIHDMFKEGEWVTIFGESLYSTGYVEWLNSNRWGPQPDNKDNVQHCGALDLEGGLDDINCNAPFAFFCEIAATCKL